MKCGAPGPEQRLPIDIDEVRVEKRLPSGRQPDVALCSAGRTRVGIEIVVTHAVDADKAAAFTDLWWCELTADDVLTDPLRWKPVRDELRPWTCPTCARAKADVARRERLASERAAVEAARVAKVPQAPRVSRKDFELRKATCCEREHWSPLPGCAGCDVELAEIREDLATLARPSPLDAETIFHARHWGPALKRALRMPGHAPVMRLLRGYRLNKVRTERGCDESESAPRREGS
jgi:hypothetical protein